MAHLYADSYWWARFLLQRTIGFTYLVAFLVAVNQFRPLLGENGLLPVPNFLKLVSFRRYPSLFHFYYSDRFFGWISWAGIVLAILAFTGLADIGPQVISILVWLLLWILYLSIVNVGQTFYSFGWESILLEAGFLAIFLGPDWMQATLIVILLFRWLLFRVEFGAGLIKLRADPCWRALTCLDYHYETQPMPNPASWFAHHLPKWYHHGSVLFNFFVQLVVPFFLFAPQPIATIAGGLMIFSQLWLVLTGNYSWLNYLTIFLGLSGLGDSVVQSIFHAGIPATLPIPDVYQAIIVALALAIGIMSILPVRNMLSSHQRMNATYNPLHLVSSYGAFGSVTKERLEVIVEGTQDDPQSPAALWKEYRFKGKPGDPARTPPVVAPYHYRLDWQMWFLQFSYRGYPIWFIEFIRKLLVNDPAILRLLRENPFPAEPPRYIRAQFYRYRFTTPQERQKTGLWWMRSPVEELLPPVQASTLLRIISMQ